MPQIKFVHYAVEVIALLLGIGIVLQQQHRSLPRLIIVAYLAMSCVSDLAQQLLPTGSNTWWIIHSYNLIESILLLLFFQIIIGKARPESRAKYLIWVNIFLAIGVWVPLNVCLPFARYAPQFAGFAGLVITIVSLWAFAGIIWQYRNETLRMLWNTSDIWLVFGLTIYHAATFPLYFSLFLFPTTESWKVLAAIWQIFFGCSSIFKHCCFLYAFYLVWHKTTATSR